MNMRQNPIVWSCGMGLNSHALVVGLIEHGESYDLAMFADTGGERAATYGAIPILQAYVNAHGLPPIMRVWKKNADNSPAPTLEEDCLARKALPSIAYGFKSCSDHYKIRPQQKVIKQWQPAIDSWAQGGKVTMLIGFDLDEGHRSINHDTSQYMVRYPLVEWGWDRDACIAAVLRAGLPMPPKSSCFFCPNMRPKEILDLAHTEPLLMQRALVLEANSEAHTIAGLGRSYKWKDVVDMDAAQVKLFPDPPEQSCACID